MNADAFRLMDLAAAAAFVAEPPEGDLMRRPPRDPASPFLGRAMLASIFTGAAGLFAAVAIVYLALWYSGAKAAQTAAFAAWMVGLILVSAVLGTF